MVKKVTISFKNMYKQQGFDFPYEIMRYILAKASYEVVKKLYFTCKYFPEKYRLFLIDKLYMCNKVIFKDSSKTFSNFDVTLLNEKIWLGDTFNSNSLLWMPKIEQCTIKELGLICEDIAWNDFKIFAKAETIEKISISKVLDSDGKMVALEDICAFIRLKFGKSPPFFDIQ
uniref:Uncharacterized protein n=1 Tax=Panagrolaimus davidi TaxID=227884 RepID=A0A914PBZ7_9BILA